MADLYDETRVFNEECFDSASDFLVERFPPKRFSKLFEPGIGSGRIALLLAKRGYKITGVDISQKMLMLLEKRLAQGRSPLQISFQKADVLDLPFSESTFDIAVVVHLFYFVQEWKKAVDEILRVLRKDGPLVLMHTGTGMEVPFLNTRYKELCSEQGHLIPEFGAQSNVEVGEYLGTLGCRVEWIRDHWQWTQHIQLDKALNYMKSRTYSFTTSTPNDVHSKAIEKLESELQQQFGNLATKVEVSNQVYLVLALRR